MARFGSGQRVYAVPATKPPQVGTIRRQAHLGKSSPYREPVYLVAWDAIPGVMRAQDGFCSEVDMAPGEGPR
jgi:hypothetical protein